MPHRPSFVFMAVAGLSLIVFGLGCTSLETWDEYWHERSVALDNHFKRFDDDANLPEEDPWAVVGREGRGEENVESDPDWFWRKYIMSEQARRIDDNLNVR
ncbi:hypothetical protein [Stratiformator vulcanicus]|uniref:Lipoprotein n=1 Tax=Stratiformator vulcanicus TaxID=2527980 RepID=A0A517QZ96_9PLAN|nr:hypothetical protein [Stratiformator vulcanicus]QDT36923.1 hypothetical protein Pan189_12870 [Stratiformator vulcanicus]